MTAEGEDCRWYLSTPLPEMHPNGDYWVETLAEDIDIVARSLDLKRFVLVGHSLGGSASIAYAGENPHRVRGLLLVDPSGDGRALPEEIIEPFLAALQSDDYLRTIRDYWQTLLVGSSQVVIERVMNDLYATPKDVVAGAFRDSLLFDPVSMLQRYSGPKLSVISHLNNAPYSLHNLVSDSGRRGKMAGGWQKMTAYGIIGTGHLGSMLAEEFVRRGAIKREELWVSNRSQEKAQKLAEELGVRAADNLKVAERSDVLFLCVRPVDLKGVIAETSELLTPDKLIVSVAVDFSLRQLENLCRARAARAIPSVASGKGLGVTLLVLGSDASEDDRSLLFRLFGSIGWPVEVAEEQLEVLSDLTSSGPAYISAILREFALQASMRGAKVNRDLAEQLIKKTLIGTASLLEDNSFDDLIAMVATRGGITEEGAKVIEALSPEMFRQLFSATSAKHRLVKDKIGDPEE